MISQKHGRHESFLYLSIQKSSFQKPVNRFQYIEAKMFFGDPVSSLKIGCDDLSKKHDRRWAERRLFSLYIYNTILKLFLSETVSRADFHTIWQTMFLWWSSTKLVQTLMICKKKTWPPGAFPLYIYTEIFLLETNEPISIYWSRNVLWGPCIKII